MYLQIILFNIANLILSYYVTYRHIDIHQYDTSIVLTFIGNTILYNMHLYFPTFDIIENIEILECPYEHVYLLNNDGFPMDEIYDELIHYVNKHHHIINNYDIIISINVVPFDGLDIRHGDILNLLDPIFQ